MRQRDEASAMERARSEPDNFERAERIALARLLLEKIRETYGRRDIEETSRLIEQVLMHDRRQELCETKDRSPIGAPRKTTTFFAAAGATSYGLGGRNSYRGPYRGHYRTPIGAPIGPL